MSVRFPQSQSKANGGESLQAKKDTAAAAEKEKSLREAITKYQEYLADDKTNLERLTLIDEFNDVFKEYVFVVDDSDEEVEPEPEPEPEGEDDDDDSDSIFDKAGNLIVFSATTEAYIKFANICLKIEQSSAFSAFITIVLILAGLAVGLETYPTIQKDIGHELHILENVILGIFVLECLLKMIAQELHPWTYFYDHREMPGTMVAYQLFDGFTTMFDGLQAWNCFDFFVVVVCLMPGVGSNVAVLRLIRLLRVMKLLKQVPQLQIIFDGLISGISSILYIMLLLCLLFYLFGISAMLFFGENDLLHFKSLDIAMISLFRVATLEDWTDIMYIAMQGCTNYEYDSAVLQKQDCPEGYAGSHAYGGVAAVFFCVFTAITGLVVMSLFVGIITTSMQAATDRVKTMKIQSSWASKLAAVADIDDLLDSSLGAMTKIGGLDEQSSNPCIRKYNSIVAFSKDLVESRSFRQFILICIIIAGCTVGLSTSEDTMMHWGWLIDMSDRIILMIFLAECMLKIFAEGMTPWRYFFDAWNCFDFVVVIVCFLRIEAAVLRMLRLLRVLKLLKSIRQLQIILVGLGTGLSSIVFVFAVLFLLYYLYGVAGIVFFRGNDPVHFGHLHLVFVTLFRCSTMEDWTDVMYVNMYGCDVFPYSRKQWDDQCVAPEAFPRLSPLYFISFEILSSLIILNLVIGTIVAAMQEVTLDEVKRNNILNGCEEVMKTRGIRNYSETLEKWFDIMEVHDPLHHGQLFPSQLVDVLEQMEIKILPEIAASLRIALKRGGGHISTPSFIDLLCEDQLQKRIHIHSKQAGEVSPDGINEEGDDEESQTTKRKLKTNMTLGNIIEADMEEAIQHGHQADLFQSSGLIDVLLPMINLIMYGVYFSFLVMGGLCIVFAVIYSETENANRGVMLLAMVVGVMMGLMGLLAFVAVLKRSWKVMLFVEIINVVLFMSLLAGMILGFILIAEVEDPVQTTVEKAWGKPALRRNYWGTMCQPAALTSCDGLGVSIVNDDLDQYNVTTADVFMNSNCTALSRNNLTWGMDVPLSNKTVSLCESCGIQCADLMKEKLNKAIGPALIGIWLAFVISLFAYIVNNIVLNQEIDISKTGIKKGVSMNLSLFANSLVITIGVVIIFISRIVDRQFSSKCPVGALDCQDTTMFAGVSFIGIVFLLLGTFSILCMWKNFVSGLAMVDTVLMFCIFTLLVAGIFLSMLTGDVETLEDKVEISQNSLLVGFEKVNPDFCLNADVRYCADAVAMDDGQGRCIGPECKGRMVDAMRAKFRDNLQTIAMCAAAVCLAFLAVIYMTSLSIKIFLEEDDSRLDAMKKDAEEDEADEDANRSENPLKKVQVREDAQLTELGDLDMGNFDSDDEDDDDLPEIPGASARTE